MEGEGKIVCVTGASGYIASWLVKQLLLRRYTVNATVRSLHDPNKVQHLLALEGAKDRLRLFKADLTEEGSFDDAINGCHGVFHTASPCIFDSNDPQVEIIGPATEGTMNVLSSCAKFPSVKRVIFTSSAAAMLVNHTPTTRDTQVDESWWSDPQLCQELKLWYPIAKTLAEETAWKFAKDKGIDLVSICPGWTIGPLLQPALNESCAALLNLIGAEFYPDMTLGWVDVKDIAHAHIQAFEIQSASGRYCIVEREAHFSDVINILQRLYPTLQLPHKSVEITPCFPPCKFSRTRAQSLGIDFIPLEISLKETIESMKEKQLLSF